MDSGITVHDIFTKYLAWCEKHRSPRTAEWYAGHLKSFRQYLGANVSIPALQLKPYHVAEWIDGHPTWGNTFRGGAIVAIKRVYNWGIEFGYVDSNPVARLKKPTPKRRETYMTEQDFNQILGLLRKGDPFRRLLVFIYKTGCRPQEARHIEPRHVELDRERIVFPAEESKGKRAKRVIYLQGDSLKIIQRLMIHRTDDGKIFRNYRGDPWTKYAVCNRFFRISKATGKKMFAYAARHGFGTRKLIQGHDHLTVAALMGHTDGSMLAKCYSHIDKDDAHLKRALHD